MFIELEFSYQNSLFYYLPTLLTLSSTKSPLIYFEVLFLCFQKGITEWEK